MAEIVGLVTGISSIVATAFKISKMIYTIADELGTAGAQIRAIATDTKAMALVLHNLKTRLKRDVRTLNAQAKEVLKDSIDLCAAEMQNMDKHLMPLFGSGECQKMDFKQRTRWLFAKTKVSTSKASLDSMKLTLSLLLSTLEYMEGGDVEYVHASLSSQMLGLVVIIDRLREIVEENIRQMISSTKTTKETFLKAQQIDIVREIIYESSINSQPTPEQDRNTLPSPSSTLVEPTQGNLHLAYDPNHEATSASIHDHSNDGAHSTAMTHQHREHDGGEDIEGAHMAVAIHDTGPPEDTNQDANLAVMNQRHGEQIDRSHRALVTAAAYLHDNLSDGGYRPERTHRHEQHENLQDAERLKKTTEWTLTHFLSDDNFLQIADHIRLQRTVSGLALDTIAEIRTLNAEDTTAKINGSGPFTSYRAPTVESEREERDWGQNQQARSDNDHDHKPSETLHGSNTEQVLAQTSDSFPDDDASTSMSQESTRRRAVRGTGSQQYADYFKRALHPRNRWPGNLESDDVSSAEGHASSGDDGVGVSHPEQRRRPRGKRSPSPDFYYSPGASERRRHRSPVAASPFGPYAPPYQGVDAGTFPYNSFGQFTGTAPQTPWGHYAGVSPQPASASNFMPSGSNWGYPRPPPPPSTSSGRPSPEPKKPDPALDSLKAQLEALWLEREKQEQAREVAERERRIREDAEREFKARMEAMDLAREEAQREIELVKIAAERAARERLEEEHQAEEERRQAIEDIKVRAELTIREKMEQSALEKKQRQGFLKYFNRF